MRTLTLVMVIVFATVTAFAGTFIEKPLHVGVTKLEVSDGTRKYLVLVTVVEPTNFPYDKNGWRWGAEGNNPKQIVSKIEVEVNGHQVFVPISSYLDLGNPRAISGMVKNKELALVIKGGEAATSYEARLKVGNEAVKHRKVVSGEFSKESTEETTYRYPSM
jgi:hypothetical protein